MTGTRLAQYRSKNHDDIYEEITDAEWEALTADQLRNLISYCGLAAVRVLRKVSDDDINQGDIALLDAEWDLAELDPSEYVAAPKETA